MNINWLWIHLLPSLGFIFALILLSHILREQRSPTSTLAMVGSANMDMRSLLLNYEIALFIYNEPVIAQVDVWMQALKSHCAPREASPRSVRGLMEGVGRLFAPPL